MSAFGFQTGLTLKALLENPNLQNPMLDFNDSEKKEDGKESPRIDMGSAFLGPNLWDKTYDLDDFKLEYMDLDEFLSENGLPIAADDGSNVSPPSSVNSESSRSNQARTPPVGSAPQVTALPPVGAQTSPPGMVRSSPTSPASPQRGVQDVQRAGKTLVEDVPIEFAVSSQELALVTIPGEQDFDPRKHKFTDEDLKPQPMIKKSKKVFVPDGDKDDRYWCRRKKNNVAAKRSRDARRVKENQIAMRASYLERENIALKEEAEKMRRENIRLKAALSKYEKQS